MFQSLLIKGEIMKEYFIENHNAYMRYQDFPGEGDPILFIHGLGCAGSFDYGEVVSQEYLKIIVVCLLIYWEQVTAISRKALTIVSILMLLI